MIELQTVSGRSTAKSINSNTNSNSLDATKENADISDSYNEANADPFLKNYQANEKERLERLAKIKAYDPRSDCLTQ